MSDKPYTLIVEPTSVTKVTQWQLGAHTRGVPLSRAMLTAEVPMANFATAASCIAT